VPQVTASVLTALKGDPALPDEYTLTRQLADGDRLRRERRTELRARQMGSIVG
jgi:hypothetical protein